MSALLGNNTRNHTEIKEFLRTINFEKLIEAQNNLTVFEDDFPIMFPFGVSVDGQAKNPILPKKFDEALLQGIQVPLIIGYTNNEVVTMLSSIGDDFEKVNQNLENKKPSTYCRYVKNGYNVTLNDLKPLYFNGGQITKDNFKNITHLYSDIAIVEGTHKTLKVQAEKGKKLTYFYVYTYDKTLSALKRNLKINETGGGAAHTDDLDNLFRQKFYESIDIGPLKKGTDPYKLMEQMIEMWVNFATTGNPTPTTSELIPIQWLPLNDGSTLSYLNLKENLRMEKKLSLVDLFNQLSSQLSFSKN